MKKALITGVTGQDGSFLSELLLRKGLECSQKDADRQEVYATRRSDFVNKLFTVRAYVLTLPLLWQKCDDLRCR